MIGRKKSLFELTLKSSKSEILEAIFLNAVTDYFHSSLDFDSVQNLLTEAAESHSTAITFELYEAVMGSDLYSFYGPGIFVLTDKTVENQ